MCPRRRFDSWTARLKCRWPAVRSRSKSPSMRPMKKPAAPCSGSIRCPRSTRRKSVLLHNTRSQDRDSDRSGLIRTGDRHSLARSVNRAGRASFLSRFLPLLPLLPNMNLTGTVALLTGAKRIGAIVADQLAERGVNIGICYARSRAEADVAIERVRAHGVRGEIFQADLSDPQACVDVVEQVAK